LGRDSDEAWAAFLPSFRVGFLTLEFFSLSSPLSNLKLHLRPHMKENEENGGLF
jgi:hypothetical protein